MTAKKSPANKILTRAIKFIENGWTTGSNWRNKYGGSVHTYNSKTVVSMCAFGAIEAATKVLKLTKTDKQKAINILADAIPKRAANKSITGYNDTRKSKGYVVTWFKKARENA